MTKYEENKLRLYEIDPAIVRIFDRSIDENTSLIDILDELSEKIIDVLDETNEYDFFEVANMAYEILNNKDKKATDVSYSVAYELTEFQTYEVRIVESKSEKNPYVFDDIDDASKFAVFYKYFMCESNPYHTVEHMIKNDKKELTDNADEEEPSQA